MDDTTYAQDAEPIDMGDIEDIKERVDLFPTKTLIVKFNKNITDNIFKQIAELPHQRLPNSPIRSTDTSVNIIKEFPDLYSRIKDNIDIYMTKVAGWGGTYDIDASWHIKSNPGEAIEQMQFNGSILGGALCTNGVDGDGIVISKNFRLPEDNWSYRPPFNDISLAWEPYVAKLPVSTGLMILFPSYLVHQTPGDCITCNDRGMLYFTVKMTGAGK